MKTITLILALTTALPISTGRAAEDGHEPFRPQFHFTPARNWMNDPNGMVYYDGEYHLFYQYNPFGDKWGHMSWGHAVSRDLVRWEHLPLALAEEKGVMIFSGSVVVDWKNSSGFGRDGQPPLVAIYTGHYTGQPLQNQQIAYSNDRGRTWTKFPGNPVLDIGARDFRDPKVFWHEPTRRWVMTVAWPNERKVRFYSSANLKEWVHLSDFGPAGAVSGIWECPDLFPVAIDNSRDRKWVLIVNVGSGAPAGGSGCQYFIGGFDGHSFTLDPSYPLPQPEFVPDGQVLADFENGYGQWRATGDAFGSTPATGTLPNQQAVDGFHGSGLVNTFRGGDQAQGTLVSPEFQIARDHLSFLIGGGRHPGQTGLRLLIGGQPVRTATGSDSERLAWQSWDVREFHGQRATLEIFDRHTGGWGHINVDRILLADRPATPATQPALWADYAPDFYAAVSWSDLPKRDGHRLWLGWMSNWQYANDVPTSPWRSAMSLPRELTLHRAPEGLRLVQQPVRELERIRSAKHSLKNASLAKANDWLARLPLEGNLWELELDLEPSASSSPFGLKLLQASNQVTLVTCDPAQGTITLDRTRSGLTGFHPAFPGVYTAPLPAAKRTHLRLFIDTSSIELFANHGRTVLTSLVLPQPSNRLLELWSSADPIQVRRLTLWRLDPK